MKHSVMLALVVILSGGCNTVVQEVSRPAGYEAEARILVREYGGGAMAGADASFLRTQCEMVRGVSMIKMVVTNLKLQEVWGTNGLPMAMQDACDVVSRSLTVEPYRDTQLIAVRVARPDPEEAARIANEVVALFRDMRLVAERTKVHRGIEAFEGQLQRQEGKVAGAEAKCEELRKSLGISVLASMDESRIPQLRANQAAAHAEADALKLRLEKTQGLSDEEMATVAAVMLNDDSAATIRKRIVETQTGAVAGGTNVTIEGQKVELAASVARIRKALQSQYEVADAKAKVLDTELDAVGNGDEKRSAPYRAALRELDVQRTIMDILRAKVVSAGAEMEIPRSPVEIVEPAEPPARPGQSR